MESWEKKYVPWYHIIKEVFGSMVPPLLEDEILKFVSKENWMIIPVGNEKDKKHAKKANRPNLTIEIRKNGILNVGIIYEKIDDVRKLRNILLEGNTNERNNLLTKLNQLSDIFVTQVDRKTKPNHPSQTPKYECFFETRCNTMDLKKFEDVFLAVDKIMDERDTLESKWKFQLAPVVNLVYGKINTNNEDLKKALNEIKPIYSMILKIKTKEEIEVCTGCLCFSCYDKGKYPECNCPCQGFPKDVRNVTFCGLSEEYS